MFDGKTSSGEDFVGVSLDLRFSLNANRRSSLTLAKRSKIDGQGDESQGVPPASVRSSDAAMAPAITSPVERMWRCIVVLYNRSLTVRFAHRF
ncbi:hypothetical protein Q31b_32430 [Novipirellula aureliae]|uniref:Uncharacterized protein n=1 Tax=Novipirellula aureliae TaxID=2527966 RepID=A0A5C6DVF1_9BACT|nr:hypothetical protein Q31b_32430 [Novipirellula aureliae]